MLFDAGEERRWGTDESEFNRVFMTSNDEQLKRKSPWYERPPVSGIHL
jgi:hypothetical protein